MADDIDDLLAEVESEYLSGGKTTCSKGKPSIKKSKGDHSSRTDELNDLLDDLKIEPIPEIKHKVIISEPLNKSGNYSKCMPTCIGGSNDTIGLSTALEKKCCSRLRCTHCDFNLIMVDDRAWHKSTDYLFLRNNMPDIDKMKTKLVVRKGGRAYACQCQFRSVTDLADIRQDTSLKWVCGKH
ncbi:DgyrCDS4848 [Dimorphilus gyrociliatus]|uniref:Cilia- and flagella-associated protein 418 n=1 Tax=Dimorphilus gyrociliatus TaxID=2664684 RepID=A0A7I8VI67_9ANNE|nr:DgyrCDS4848 [Dimorphilus gyrociliatus]